MRCRTGSWVVIGLIAAVACGRDDPATEETTGEGAGTRRIEATSLLGRPLNAPDLPLEFRAEQEALLAKARRDLESRPDSVDAIIWVGRRTAYLGRYGEAVEVYSRGIESHPEDARLYRHRGHRLITLRRLDEAIADLEKAAALVAGAPDEIEPDGLPNERNIPTSTTHSNIWYHLGLARYLTGDFEPAARAYRECMKHSNNPDMLSATTHWLYMTLRRSGRHDEARTIVEPIRADMDIIENRDYHRLLMMYKKDLAPEEIYDEASVDVESVAFATTAYGVGNWYLYNGDGNRAMEVFRRIVETDSWAAFGFIAAEADLAR